LPEGATAALNYSTQLYQLPISLFGMAVSSAALPSLSAAVSADVPEFLRERLLSGQEAITALVVPSMVAFLAFGDVMIALLFQHGRFTDADTQYAWGVLAGSAVGLLATTVSRLYSSAFYALRDTRTPMMFAIIRVVFVVVLGFTMALKLPPMLGIPLRWGTAGLTASAGIAGWIEFMLLRRALRKRIGAVTIPASFLVKAWLVAAVAAIPATALRWVLPHGALILRGIVILGAFGLLYLALADRVGVLKLSEARALLRGRRK
jgi:putative peptidoglycan lipid II flippase